ncbi:hypothetical protein VP01_5566g1, partial [Puccinia sorghi]
LLAPHNHSKKKKKKHGPQSQNQSSQIHRKKKSNLELSLIQDNPIIVESDEGENQLINNSIPDDEDAEISYLEEIKISEINHANTIMQFGQVSLDDNDTTDDDEPTNNEDEPLQERFWSSGMKGYQKHTENLSSSSSKLMLAKGSRKTKHNQIKKHNDALWKNKNMISAWLNQPAPSAVTLCLETYQNTYLAEPKNVECLNGDATTIKAQTQWKTLENSIKIAATIYRKKAMKYQNFGYPEAMLANLIEFNYLQRQYTLQGIPGPSLLASKEAAVELI